MTFQQTDYFKGKAKHRYKIEAKNSELKNVHGYTRASSYGIANMQMQGAMCNGHFYCKPEKNPQVNELIVAPNPNTPKTLQKTKKHLI